MVPAQATSTLRVFVVYDPDRDGTVQGVGSFKEVKVVRGVSVVDTKYTTPDSEVTFTLERDRLYHVTAKVEHSNRFMRWICKGFRYLRDPAENLIITCEEKFSIFFPWLNGE